MGKVDFGGVIRKACLQYVPDARVNQYALIHVGFALSTIEEDEAERTLAMLRSIGDPYAEWDGAEDGAAP